MVRIGTKYGLINFTQMDRAQYKPSITKILDLVATQVTSNIPDQHHELVS
jgi:hypothetical protein